MYRALFTVIYIMLTCQIYLLILHILLTSMIVQQINITSHLLPFTDMSQRAVGELRKPHYNSRVSDLVSRI